MVRKTNSGWRAVQLPKELVDEIEVKLKLDVIKKHGITSISQFISRVISAEFDKIDGYIEFEEMLQQEALRQVIEKINSSKTKNDDITIEDVKIVRPYWEKKAKFNEYIRRSMPYEMEW